MRTVPVFSMAASALLIAGCASTAEPGAGKPLALASQVDLPRFMGEWFVIANIPTTLEDGAYNAKDTYRLDADGTVATSFTFNSGDFDGPRRQIDSRGYVTPGTNNAVWGQQYVWPVKADYRISYLSNDYRTTVIAREKRDHVWIMARTPTISEGEYARLAAFVAAQGYDATKLQRVPQASGK